MEKLWKRLFFALLAVVIAGNVACIISLDIFDQDGIHWFGNNMHISLYKTCYFIDRDTLEITGNGKFSIRGYWFDDFTGSMNLEEYPMTVSTASSVGVIKHNRKQLTFSGHGVTLNENWERYYIVHLLRADTDILVINIFQNHGETLVAVCADSPEEALENYRIYLEEFSYK